MVGFVLGDVVPWTVPPDWSNPVRETLTWLTDYMSARNGARQKRQLRLAPRRSFQFQVLAIDAEHRLIDALRFDQGARVWALPIWPDGQFQASDVAPGSNEIECATAGRDFAVGGSALLWTAINEWEVVSVATVEDGGLTLNTPTLGTWGAGSRLYPLRNARVPASIAANYRTDAATSMQVTMQVDEPCDWTGVAPTAVYRGFPVLELRHDETEDPTTKFDRSIQQVDGDTGVIAYLDLPNRSFRQQSHSWKLHGLAEHGAFRDLVYWLRGRMGTLWVPSFAADLLLTNDASAADNVIHVEWAGYTVFGRQQSNRRDVRIELLTGTVLYRRITASAEAGATETLTLDTALGVALPRRLVRAISFLTLAEQATDTVTIDHITGIEGVATATTSWAGIRHDV
ncbi:hypothetical protein [Pinirhizobacter sp.]|jgi:hypothetical protein|uniref:hypothetical protein n=1 Tax=Pinirhizobacter sp. TaxID=2950432 RepID=UPI002F3E32BA